jgi:hypothetical protein
MLFKTILAIAATAALASALYVTAGADDPPAGKPHVPFQREVPDNPPGKPAQPVPGATAAAPIRVGIATTYQVNVDLGGANIPGDAANEPSIAVDPNNPNRMAIGWRQFDTIASNYRQAGFAYTEDGGRTWTFPGVLEPDTFRSDPVLGSDAYGVFYYNSLKVMNGVFSNQVFESTDGGQTWGAAVEAFGGDKQWMTIDATGGMGDGHLYCAWSTAAGCCSDSTFTRSVDGASSFEYPVKIPSTPIWGTLDVDSDGNLYLAGASPLDLSEFYVSKSSNAKDPLVTPTFDWTHQVFMNGTMRFNAGPNPGGLLGQAWIALDRSGGPNDGNIYLLCCVDPPDPDLLDVHFIRSTDGGDSWSFPVSVNDVASSPFWQWFGMMSVAPSGRIDVVWNDARDSGVSYISALYYSYSADGGLTWSADQRVSPTFNSHQGWPNQNKIGDYYDMVSDEVGVSVAWAATFNGEQDVYYTRIGDYDCNVNGVPDSVDIATKQSGDINENGIPDECEGLPTAAAHSPSPWQLMQNVPNPFNPSTTIRFVVPEGGAGVTLRVYDAAGRLVRTLLDGFQPGGPGTAVWDGTDAAGDPAASGLYFYRLEADGFTQTKKMLLLK